VRHKSLCWATALASPTGEDSNRLLSWLSGIDAPAGGETSPQFRR